ncbi:MAG: Dna2/Cas4 domain-containing protein, partial [archaeon]
MNNNIKDWDEILFTGVQIQYYFIDPRRLWYFSKGITMEHNSELVEIGKIITNEFYKRDKKEIQIGRIKIDFYKKNLEIHEVKKSSKFIEASRWQLIY